jgi:hypothetical protein
LKPITVLILVATLTLLALPVASVSASTPPRQVIFSSTNSAGSGGPLTPFGFWIWCFATGSVPYTGECTGFMYFYGTKDSPVDNSAAPSIGTTSATIHVQATDGSFQCDLTGPIGKGVTVTVTCNSGPRTGTDTMPNSAVVVEP